MNSFYRVNEIASKMQMLHLESVFKNGKILPVILSNTSPMVISVCTLKDKKIKWGVGHVT